MSPNDVHPDDDSFERALCEYREETWDPAEFEDLPTRVQCDIVQRACDIQAASDRLKELRLLNRNTSRSWDREGMSRRSCCPPRSQGAELGADL
jgi:hypothetical protein